MSEIPYFLRSPAYEEQEQRPLTMAAAAAPQGMAAPVVQHPMHAMVVPIMGAPPKLSSAALTAPPDDLGPEPAAMSQSDIEGMGASTPPTMAAAKQPTVRTMSPIERREDELEQGLANKPHTKWQKFRHIAGMVGRIGGDIVAPGLTEGIVGELGEQGIGPEANPMRRAELMNLEKQKSEQALQGAQTSNQQAETNLHNTQEKAAQLVEITPEEAQSMGNPALAGQQVTQGVYQHLITNAGTTQGRQNVAELNNDTKRDIADANNLTKSHLATLKPEQRDDRAIRLMEKPADQRTPEENAYLGSYARWVQQTKVEPGIARGQAFNMFRPVQVLGPDGNVQYQTAGNAIKSGASTPQSMNFRTGVGMAKFMTSGKGGQTITAYNTANDHLDLLGKAMEALQNGDVQGLNQLNNSFKQQFGSAAPTNVNAVKAMLAGELANVAKVTGATDQEINEQKANINRAASPEQIKGFIDTNHDLMDQKAYEMYQQYQQGMQGQPAFGTGRPLNGPGGTHSAQVGGNPGVPKGATHTVPGSDGKMHYTDGKNDLGVVK